MKNYLLALIERGKLKTALLRELFSQLFVFNTLFWGVSVDKHTRRSLKANSNLVS